MNNPQPNMEEYNMRELKDTYDFTNHLRHCIQETEGIQLSDKSVKDILLTILGASRASTTGMRANMMEWHQKYFDLLRERNIGYEDIKNEQ